MSEIFMVLSETIRDNFRNSKLKQSLLPCLGEFLFYAATQEENEGRLNENWEVPGRKATAQSLHLSPPPPFCSFPTFATLLVISSQSPNPA